MSKSIKSMSNFDIEKIDYLHTLKKYYMSKFDLEKIFYVKFRYRLNRKIPQIYVSANFLNSRNITAVFETKF